MLDPYFSGTKISWLLESDPGLRARAEAGDLADGAWGGIGDISMDGLGIVGKTPVSGLYLNGGWGYSGFKATPAVGWTLAHTIANEAPHALNAPFALNRFETGALIDEHGAAAVAH